MDATASYVPYLDSEPNSPQARNAASLEPLGQCSDALGGVGAASILCDATEHVADQTAALGRPDIQSVIRRPCTH
eukprot:6376090-Prymnesium_polylepis.2